MRGEGAAWVSVRLGVPSIATGAGGVITPSTLVSVLAWSNAGAELSRRRFSVNGEGGEWCKDIEVIVWMFNRAAELS